MIEAEDGLAAFARAADRRNLVSRVDLVPGRTTERVARADSAFDSLRGANQHPAALVRRFLAGVRDQIVDGQLRKWYQQVVLVEQPFRDTDITVGQLITDAIARIGENIRVRRFIRFALGEEL